MSLSEKVARSLSHLAPKPGDAGADQVARIERLRAAAKTFAQAVEENVGEVATTGVAVRKPSRESSLAITSLETALMWAVKGVVLE